VQPEGGQRAILRARGSPKGARCNQKERGMRPRGRGANFGGGQELLRGANLHRNNPNPEP